MNDMGHTDETTRWAAMHLERTLNLSPSPRAPKEAATPCARDRKRPMKQTRVRREGRKARCEPLGSELERLSIYAVRRRREDLLVDRTDRTPNGGKSSSRRRSSETLVPQAPHDTAGYRPDRPRSSAGSESSVYVDILAISLMKPVPGPSKALEAFR